MLYLYIYTELYAHADEWKWNRAAAETPPYSRRGSPSRKHIFLQSFLTEKKKKKQGGQKEKKKIK